MDINKFWINLCIGILVFLGFFIYWGRVSGWYKEGGLIYELWHEWRNKKEQEKSKKKNSDK